MPELNNMAVNFASDTLDDMERVRIAMSNRIFAMNKLCEQAGITVHDDPILAKQDERAKGMLETATLLESDAIKMIQAAFRSHPLAPWAKTMPGLGEKQLARLLATIGDPYWNDLHDRPRRVSELWAYCGMHVVDGKAPARAKGKRANWSQDARMRVYLCALSCLKAGTYRAEYDLARSKCEEAVHTVPCQRCTGQGVPPAAVGTPLKPAHQHMRGIRAISKAILKDVWLQARALHGVTGESSEQEFVSRAA